MSDLFEVYVDFHISTHRRSPQLSPNIETGNGRDNDLSGRVHIMDVVNENEDGTPQDSMHYVQQDDNEDPQWIDNAYINNDYVEFEEPPPDDEEDDWIQASMVENVAIGGNLTDTSDNDATGFKVGDTFESKAILVNSYGVVHKTSSSVQAYQK